MWSFAVWLFFFSVYVKNIPVLVINLFRYTEMSLYQRNDTKKSDHTHVPFMWPILKENCRNYAEIHTVVFVVSFGKSSVMY